MESRHKEGMGVFNGDLGVITSINSFGELLTVEYEEGRFVDYTLNSWMSWSWHMRLPYIRPREVNIRRS